MSRCATTSDLLGEPMAGTAPVATSWLALEQSGPWGHQALTESHLDPAISAALTERTKDTGVKVLLIRRPGRHADDHHTIRHRTAYLAHSVPGRVWLRRLDVPDPADLLDLDFAALGAGIEPSIGARDDLPLLLVCTNAKRDRCCAIAGRPAAAAANAAHPGRVWECSHLGGHRFAATAVVLPHGFVHGRLDADSAPAVLAATHTGRVDFASARGRSCWDGPGQAAEAHLRVELGLDGLDDVTDVRTAPNGDHRWSVELVLASGERHHVPVREVVDDAVLRPESCVKPAVPLRAFAVDPVRDAGSVGAATGPR